MTVNVVDANGDILSTERTTTYSYDPGGRLHTLKDTKIAAGVFTYAYNDGFEDTPMEGEAGRNNTGHVNRIISPVGNVSLKTFDSLGQLDLTTSGRLQISMPDASPVFLAFQKFDYQVNAIGQRTHEVVTDSQSINRSRDFIYDPQGRLREAAVTNGLVEEYTYDGIGNREEKLIDDVTTTYEPDGLNQYETITRNGSAVSLKHDLCGNLTDDGPHRYTWSDENRLLDSRNLASNRRSAYSYDGLGRRIMAQHHNSDSGDALAEEIRYLYDGWNVVAELDSSNSVTRDYIWGLDVSQSMGAAGGVGGLLAAVEANGEVYEYFYDGNGNVSTVVAENGELVASYAYDGFGNITISSGSYSESNRYRYSTKLIEDWADVFYYYGYRYYAPTEGRWLSRDPIGENGGLNLYGFVNNDPVNKKDYLGLIDPEILFLFNGQPTIQKNDASDRKLVAKQIAEWDNGGKPLSARAMQHFLDGSGNDLNYFAFIGNISNSIKFKAGVSAYVRDEVLSSNLSVGASLDIGSTWIRSSPPGSTPRRDRLRDVAGSQAHFKLSYYLDGDPGETFGSVYFKVYTKVCRTKRKAAGRAKVRVVLSDHYNWKSASESRLGHLSPTYRALRRLQDGGLQQFYQFAVFDTSVVLPLYYSGVDFE